MTQKRREHILALIIFFGLSVVFTYPLIFRLNSSTYGYPGDNFGTMWHLWWNKYSISEGIPTRYTPFLNAPFGKDLGVDLNAAVIYSWSLTALTFVFNPLVAFNLIVFIGFPLAALTMYFLARLLTKSFWAAVLAGIIFSFSPYHFWKAYNHADLASIQWLPLYVLSLIKLFEEKNYRWALLTAASFTLVTLTSFYYGYFMILFTIGFVVVYGFSSLTRDRRSILKNCFNSLNLRMAKMLVLTGVLAGLFILPFTYRIFLVSFVPKPEYQEDKQSTRLVTKVDELLALSSRPWDFFVPSEDHPVFGKYVNYFCPFLAKRSGGFESQCTHYPQERNIYLGWVGMGLSAFALKNFRKNKKWILIFASLALLMVWASFPAFMNVKGRKIYFPSYFLHTLAPMFRTYARLGVLVLLCVSVLAAFGFKFLLERVRSRRGKILLMIFAFCILHFEFLNFPPFRYTDLSETPPVYQWLKEQPGDFIIAEYPQPYSEAEAMFFQINHQKRMITVTEELADLYQSETVEKLRDLGVKYVVAHTDNIFPGDPYNGDRRFQLMSPPETVEGLKSVKPLPKAIVYEVEAD